MRRFARNKAEAARILEISRSGLYRFFELPDHPEPRSDGRIDCRAWAKFISANATRLTTGTAAIPIGPKDTARIRLMELQALREETRLNREREILVGEVKAILQAWSGRLQLRLDHLARTELPPILDGKPAREIGRIIRDKMVKAWNETPFKVCVELDKATGKLRARDVTNVIEFDKTRATTSVSGSDQSKAEL